MDYQNMQLLLREQLRLYHFPIAVKFLYEASARDRFLQNLSEYYKPSHPMTFCQWEIAARMKGLAVYAEKKDLGGCSSAFCSFGWQEPDEAESRAHLRYTQNLEQAARFLATKPALKPGLVGIIVAPLAMASAFDGPDVVHFYCDALQAYHLAVDYMAATDAHPLRPFMTMTSAGCGGCVWCFKEQEFNLTPPCSGGYNAGKAERGEVNVMIPGSKIALVCARLQERTDKYGSGAITRLGDGFPGADICKNCPHLAFHKAGEQH